MADETSGSGRSSTDNEVFQSAQLMLDSIRWEFQMDDSRHQSFTSRATVLLGVDITILVLMFTGASFLIAHSATVDGYALYLGLLLFILVTVMIVASGVIAGLAMTASPIEMPNIESLLDPRRYTTDADVVARDFAEAYRKSVRSHREKGQVVARRINASTYLLLTALVLTGILVLALVIGRR